MNRFDRFCVKLIFDDRIYNLQISLFDNSIFNLLRVEWSGAASSKARFKKDFIEILSLKKSIFPCTFEVFPWHNVCVNCYTHTNYRTENGFFPDYISDLSLFVQVFLCNSLAYCIVFLRPFWYNRMIMLILLWNSWTWKLMEEKLKYQFWSLECVNLTIKSKKIIIK